MPATVSHYETDAPLLQMQMLHTIRRDFAEEPADISATDVYDARLLKKSQHAYTGRNDDSHFGMAVFDLALTLRVDNGARMLLVEPTRECRINGKWSLYDIDGGHVSRSE